MRRAFGFLVIWGLGLWPPLVPFLPITAAGVILFFLGLPQITRRLGIGGYPTLGLARTKGWPQNLILGFGAGSLFPLALFVVLFGTGSLTPIGWADWSHVWGRGLFILANTCYIGFWEELLCRGYLLRVLPGRFSPIGTLAIAGSVFSIFHLPRFGAPAPWWAFWFVSGILFAWPVLVTGSLWFSIGMHWGLDLVWFCLLLDDGLLRYGPGGTSVLNSGTVPLAAVLLFVPVIWSLATWLKPRQKAHALTHQSPSP